MKPLTDFLPEVLPHVAGCPVPVAINAVRNSVIKFLENTNLLEQTVAIDLDPEEFSFPIECEGGAKAVTFIVGYINGQRVDPVAPEQLDGSRPDWRNETGVPREAFIRNGALIVVPRPVVVCSINASFYCSIKRSSSGVDDSILEDWCEAIAAGALHKLLLLPNTPWANADLAEFYRQQYQNATTDAGVFGAKGGTRQSLRATPRPFQ